VGLERRAISGAESERRETARDREQFLELLNPVRIAGLGPDKNGRMLESKGWRTSSREEVDV
jgi:hypothetical protein